jgi:hypothetical protein
LLFDHLPQIQAGVIGQFAGILADGLAADDELVVELSMGSGVF